MPLRAVATLCLFGLASLAAQDSELDRRLRDLAPHPRLFLSDEVLAQRRQQQRDDAALRRCVDTVLQQAEGCLALDDLRYEKRGPRLLHVSRECLRRVQALALAWRWTGDERFAARAVRDLRTVAAFADWNPSHFLDVAEMTHAVALGYDWLLPQLGDDDRAAVRGALVRNGLAPGREAYAAKAWWARSAFNWNQVCNAGLLIGALAVADEEPALARVVLEHAIGSLPTALASYEPDGGWMEGPGYWDYATRYTAYGIDALRSALGTDFGLATRDGLRRAAWFPICTAGPTGLFFNFADAGETSRRGPSPCMFWLAGICDEPAFAAAEHTVLRDHAAQAMHVAWYVPPAADDLPIERARLFRGGVPVAVFRSAWGERDASFLAVKGGYNQVNHGHLDLGSFVFDALGERWALDLGSDDYNLPGYWEGKRGGRRWSYYRLASRSHDVVCVDGADQDPLGKAEVLRFSAEQASVVLDLGSAYPAATRAQRGVALVDRAALVQDEFEFAGEHEVFWGMTTRADVELGERREALLTSGGRQLVARALTPADATWRVASAEQAAPQRRNVGVRRLELRVPPRAGTVRVAVLLVPRATDGDTPSPPVRALAEW
ncbi:MAG: heparinase II/III family protein [Planctomycetota bacterium]